MKLFLLVFLMVLSGCNYDSGVRKNYIISEAPGKESLEDSQESPSETSHIEEVLVDQHTH